MRFIAKTSQASTVDRIVSDLRVSFDDPFDIGIIFYTPALAPQIQEVIRELRKVLNLRHIVGCSSAGIIGNEEEIETETAVSLFLASLPGVHANPFYIQQDDLAELTTQEQWYEFLNVFPNEEPSFFLLPDPFRLDLHRVVDGINLSYQRRPLIGGLASGGSTPHSNTLICNDRIYHEGAVGLTLTGNVKIKTVVSQGCRPVGKSFIVTRAEGNIIYEVAGKTFLQWIKEEFHKVQVPDRRKAQDSLFLGIAMDEYKHSFDRGDFVIRPVLGVDSATEAGVIGDRIMAGQTVQLQLRDARTATEDLQELLRLHVQDIQGLKPLGALIFSCNGRGQELFKEQNHDIKIIQSHVGPVPAAGFFCAGEIGPIGGKNFIHGFTDSIALFYPASKTT